MARRDRAHPGSRGGGLSLTRWSGGSDVDVQEEMKLGIKPAAEALGLTLQDLGRQVRQAFYGEETQRIQRGRDDIRVMVRYPRDQRRSLGDLENMRIRTPDGGEVPFGQVAVVEPGRGFASIRRVDRNRAVNVTASVDATATSAGDVIADLNARILCRTRPGGGRAPRVSLGFGMRRVAGLHPIMPSAAITTQPADPERSGTGSAGSRHRECRCG